MVGMGVDLADLPEYVGCNDLGTAVLLAAMARAGVRRLVLASSMVVYGEGAYALPGARPDPRRHRARPPTWPPAGSSRAARPAARRSTPALVDEDAPLDPRSVYAATKVAQEHLARGVGARSAAARVVALRYHNVYGPGMPRDTPYSGVAAIFRSALEAGRRAAGLRGRRAAPRLRARRATWPRPTSPPLARPGTRTGLAGVQHRLRPTRRPSARWPTALGRGDAAGRRRCVTGEFRVGDVRHVVASPGPRPRRARLHRRGSASTKGCAEFATAALRG